MKNTIYTQLTRIERPDLSTCAGTNGDIICQRPGRPEQHVMLYMEPCFDVVSVMNLTTTTTTKRTPIDAFEASADALLPFIEEITA